MEGPDWIQLDRCGEHNVNSHDENNSKYLKHDPIVAVSDAVTIAPQQLAAQLQRNLQSDQAYCAASPLEKLIQESLR
jgi:N-acetylglucosamine-6-phosphate deacetylase